MEIGFDALSHIIQFYLTHPDRLCLIAIACPKLNRMVQSYYAELKNRIHTKTIPELYAEIFFDIREVLRRKLWHDSTSVEAFSKADYFKPDRYPFYTEAGFASFEEDGRNIYCTEEEQTLERHELIIRTTHRWGCLYLDDCIRAKCLITDLILKRMIQE